MKLLAIALLIFLSLFLRNVNCDANYQNQNNYGKVTSNVTLEKTPELRYKTTSNHTNTSVVTLSKEFNSLLKQS